jgi:cell division protein FtsN
MLFGLGIGLIIALGVYMNGRPTPNAPASEPVAARRAESPVAESEPITPVPEPVQQPEPETVVTSAAPPASEDGENPERFGFFELLPNFEVIIPEVETAAPRTEAVAAIEDPGVYVIQAGSFLTEADADAQRARLALLGIESRIQRVSIDDRTFHRVRIGPVEDLDELNSIRSRLLGSGVESMIMRITL